MYATLEQALLDLEKAGLLKRIHDEVDPNLEMAEMARIAFEKGGPALLFENVKDSKFPAVANLYGTQQRMDFLFRDSLESTKAAVLFKSNPVDFFKHPHLGNLILAAKAGLHSLPVQNGSIADFEECSLQDLPQIKCAPDDGGAFLTLPQVASRPGKSASVMTTNLGMYRIQISGNEYGPDECGLHYQIKRDIARHHQKAIEEGRPLKVSIFLGGPPAHTIAAIMPMPENLSELLFAGMLSGRRFRYFIHNGYLVSSDADFCILGEVAPDLKPEGPFADHVGYYSGKHLFPYLKVKKVLCKKNAIYPFTVVGRPPQEDTLFGNFIHKVTKPMVPASLPGVHAVHAVDAAGVHPFCLALGSESFRPYVKPEEREPMELLKTANALLGFNQVSLTKYLMIAAKEDNPKLDVNKIPEFFGHILERLRTDRDLHFQTETTTDTLDYTGGSLNHGSKLVIAAAGPKIRHLRNDTTDLQSLCLPASFAEPKIVMPGVLALKWNSGMAESFESGLAALRDSLAKWNFRENYPWISIVDDTSTLGIDNPQTNLQDFLWLTFTRSDPALDLYGLNECYVHKHWACEAPLIVDARIKPHHQKAITFDKAVRETALKKLQGIL